MFSAVKKIPNDGSQTFFGTFFTAENMRSRVFAENHLLIIPPLSLRILQEQRQKYFLFSA